MTDRRRKDVNWTAADKDGATSMDGAQLAVLMDIRDELQTMNASVRNLLSLASCKNVRLGFVAMKKLRTHMEAIFPRRRKLKKHKAVIRRKRKP